MVLNNIKTKQKDSGFTIVELLVVIVVIGILAAITIVSYTGITAKANTSSAQSAANAVISKAGAYGTDPASTTPYPTTLAALTGASADKVYALTGVTFNASPSTAQSSPNNIQYQICGVQASGTNAAPTTTAQVVTMTGINVGYLKYETPAVNFLSSGQISGLVGSQTIGCVTTAS